MPARRADSGRPQLRVHAARRRDVLRRRGGRVRGDRTPVCAHRARDPGRRGCHAVPPDDLRRDDGPVRLGQARPAVRDGAHGRRGRVRGDRVPGVRVGVGAGGLIKALSAPGGAELSRKELDGLVQVAKSRGAAGLVWIVVESDGIRSPVEKHLSPTRSTSCDGRPEPVPATSS
ncbi:MAG: hypothetical protein EHM22_06300 [Actinobacteria bacterium]|nr:MAG: hypothetical protein EHM22_06300 [Actinomycetota bacterium]